MKKCIKCGADIPDDSVICPNCGGIIKNSKPILIEKLGLTFSIIGFVISAAMTALTFVINLGFTLYLGLPSLAFGLTGCVLSSISIKRKKSPKSVTGLVFSIISLLLFVVCVGFYLFFYFLFNGMGNQ